MKILRDTLEGIKPLEIRGEASCRVGSLHHDSREVKCGGVFFAIIGEQSDGHNYIAQAVANGAVAVVCQHLPEHREAEVCYIVVDNTNIAMGRIASSFYDHPSREMSVVGVTGTNGKTTTATLLYDLFTALGYRTGLISTVVYKIGAEEIASTHTTPDAVRLSEMMRRMVDSGCEYCFMELSSHAIAQHRVEGITLRGAIFSNITHDHLDYHKTFSEYIRVKKSLFDSLPPEAFALTNIDDRNGRVMVQNCKASTKTYSLRNIADFSAKLVEMHFDGMLLKIADHEVWTKLIGRFNAYNLLAVYATAEMLGISREQTLLALSSLGSVSGRFECIKTPSGRVAIVDYAHTPDALESVLKTIEEIRCAGQDLYVVCGCGGERDKGKRPLMAQIATNYATMSIFTSDNPRSESAEAILDDMIAGLKDCPTARYLRITNRKEAIRAAMMLSKKGDIVLVAGKGHEQYQIVGIEKVYFSDIEEVIS